MRSYTRRHLGHIAFATLALSLSACGGGGSDSGGNDTSAPGPDSSPSANQAPTVDLGSQFEVTEGNELTLSATASDSDGTIESYSWEQTSGPDVNMVNADTAQMTFMATETTSDVPLIFSVTVTDDDGATAMADTTVNVMSDTPENMGPRVDAGDDRTEYENTTFTLEGSVSAEDGLIEDWEWVQVSGPDVTLEGADTNVLTVTVGEVDEKTSVVFELSATDDEGATGTDTITVDLEKLVTYSLPLEGIPGDVISVTIHPDTPDIALAASTPAIVGQESTGMYFTEDRGETWTLAAENLASYRMTYSKTSPAKVLATTPNAFNSDHQYSYGISEDYGRTWTWRTVPETLFGDAITFSQIEFDPIDTNEILAMSGNAIGGGFYIKESGNDVFTPLAIDAELFYDKFVQTPADPDQIVFSTGVDEDLESAVLKSIDNGNSVTSIVNGLPTGTIGRFEQVVIVSDNDADLIYVNGYLSRDGGTTYTSTNIPVDVVLFDGTWYLYESTMVQGEIVNGIIKSDDFGETWKNVVSSEQLGFVLESFPRDEDDTSSFYRRFVVNSEYIYFYDANAEAIKGITKK